MQSKQLITDKKHEIQDIYNQYKEFNTDYVYQKDLEIVLTQISQKCIPLNVQHILQNIQAQQKMKLTFDEFIQLMYEQDSQDINIKQQEDIHKRSQQGAHEENKSQQQSEPSHSIKDELQKNSENIEMIINNPEKQKEKQQSNNAELTKSEQSGLKSSKSSEKNIQIQQNVQDRQNSPQKDSELSQTSSQKKLKNVSQQLEEQNQQTGNSSSRIIKQVEDIDQKLEQKKSEKNLKGNQSQDEIGQHSNQEEIKNESEDIEQSEQKRRRSSIEHSIKNQENNLDNELNSLDIMSKGSQNFFNHKKGNHDQNEVDPIQELYEGQKNGVDDNEEQNLNNFFSNNQSSVVDNSQEISDDQIMEYKQILQKNQLLNHQNNCMVLQEYQVFYKDYINEIFQKFQTLEADNQNQQDQNSPYKTEDRNQNTQKRIFAKVNNFTSLMMDLFKDKIWILTHKFDREEFYSKTNGYKKLFQTIDNYYIKVKGMDPSTFKLTEAVFDQEEFFKILEYWSSSEPQLYFSQEAPKYQNIDEEDELNYKSSLSLLSQVAQLRNNNSAISQDDTNSARKELKLVQDLQKTIQKYKKMKAESETEVEKKALNNIIADLENQLNQYNQHNNSNPHEISLLNNNYNKHHKNEGNQNNIENFDKDHHQSHSKKSIYSAPILSKEEKRDKNLHVVYKFYCKQTYVSGKYATFDRVQQETNTMSMGKFFLFVRDFGIVNKNLKKNKLVEIFKKNSSNSKDLTFEEFKQILQKISEFHSDEQQSAINIDQPKKDQQPSSIIIKTQESEEKKKDKKYKKQNSVDKFLQLEGAQLDEYLAQKSSDSNPKDQDNKSQKLEQFYNFLCIDDQNKLKEKVRSPNLPFHTHAKVEQNLVNYKFNPQKYHEKQSEEIKELLKQRKEQKEKEKAQLAKKHNDPKELPQVSISKKFSKNASKKIQNELEPIYGPTECTWESLLGNNFNQLRFLNQSEFKPTDLFDENSPEDDEYLEHYKIDYQNLEQQKQKEELLKKIEDYGQIKPKQIIQKEKNSIDTESYPQNLLLLEQSNSGESSPQQLRTNKIFIRKNLSGNTRGKSQPQTSIAQQKINKSNNYIKIDLQNESGLKNQRNLSSYDVSNNYNYGQKNGQKDQVSVQHELLQQNSSHSINGYDIQPQSSYFQTPEKKIKLRESKSLQKSQQSDNSINKSIGNINLLKNNKDLNNSSVGDLIDFFNPITDRQKNIVQNQRNRISQIENASRQKEKEMIENLINSSQNNQNLISKKLSVQMPGRQNNFVSNKKNQNQNAQ
ncbi:alpha/beta fold hydrolase (macronuclear) [Tetrahymena thermophila SB210]|uniref:Alpha/beta fold hydrolase n=1 Tax=Tetrahymena thermophila (strain SB210) TaxID=312017 RepID=I7LWY1_TETTS|nr:alpha/beta fold hydrolase [Tetrahymena thermophila SB210]EAS03072.3 alpha/beta fold hydrolase [Tetrahymena thermophila SB210]|eukprot:XP_001023317.3 alpha/beta fold hydrolase [Tetrahymena thermophila SB210]